MQVERNLEDDEEHGDDFATCGDGGMCSVPGGGENRACKVKSIPKAYRPVPTTLLPFGLFLQTRIFPCHNFFIYLLYMIFPDF